MRVHIKGVNTVRKKLANGTIKTFYYHRATGKRLDGAPGSPEFSISYGDAEKSLIERHTHGTFNKLVRDYTLSIEFQKSLASSTQTEYRRMLTSAEVEFGDMPIAVLNDLEVRKEFLDWREKIAIKSGAREADNRLSAISAMLTWATERGHITSNHVKGFKRIYHVDRSEIIWLSEHITAFMEVAPIELQRALIIALHTGQRQGDLLRLPWSAYDGACIRLRQGKARRGGMPSPLVEIPCTSALRKMLDSMERVSPLILTTKTGRALKKRYFIRLWDASMQEAGIRSVQLPGMDAAVELHFHDLRGTSVTLLSEAGSTPQQIAAITGHSLQTITVILERYLARTKGLAEQAIANLENSPRTKFANQLQTEARQEQKRTKKTKNIS